jgi:hypothetical protein
MIESAASKQNELLSIINEIFTFVIDPYTKKKKIRINPILNDETLQKTIEKTRKIIIELYVKCETDYVNGLKIYETIVEKKILETTQKQIQTLQKQATNIISETTQTTAPTDSKPNSLIPTQTSSEPISQIITEEKDKPVIIKEPVNNNLNNNNIQPIINNEPNNILQTAGKNKNRK